MALGQGGWVQSAPLNPTFSTLGNPLYEKVTCMGGVNGPEAPLGVRCLASSLQGVPVPGAAKITPAHSLLQGPSQAALCSADSWIAPAASARPPRSRKRCAVRDQAARA